MSASEYPGAEQDAQRLIDQFDALVLDGGRRPHDINIDSPDGVVRDDGDDNGDGDSDNDRFRDEDADAEEAVARLSSALLGVPASDRRQVLLNRNPYETHEARTGRRQSAISGDGDVFVHARWADQDEDGGGWNGSDDSMDLDRIGDLDRLLDVTAYEAGTDVRHESDTHRRFNASITDHRTNGHRSDGDGDDGGAADMDGDDDDLDRVRGVSSYGEIEYEDIDWGDVPTKGKRTRDGRPPVLRHAAGTHAQSSPRVIHIARGIVDDGYTVLAIDEHRLAPGGTSAYTNLNGEAYATADLVAYLYAEEPATKSVPHTRQRLTQAQVNGLLALVAAGHSHLMAPPDVDGAAYALTRPLSSPTSALSHEAAATVDAHLETALVDKERAVDLAAYHVAALVHYAIEIAMAVGWDYKPAVNFAIARYISAAGTPLLAEEGGLLPDEIPRRRRAHRLADLCDDRDSSDDGGGGGDDDDDGDGGDDAISVDDPADAARAWSYGKNRKGGENARGDGGDTRRGRGRGDVAIPAETRDEAVARHRALADRRRRHPPMGMDLELVAAVLQAEDDDGGLARSPGNLDEMRRRLRTAVGARLKPSKADRKIDRYAVPWAYGVCCALDRRDVDEVLASAAGAAAVADRINRVWAAQSVGGKLDDGATSSGRKPPRPLAPYLSDAEFAQRLARLEPSLLAALSRVIPLEARGRSDLDAGDYIIYESNLALGAPLSPPMSHSLAQKVMRFARQAGTTPRACDLAPKPPAIVFVRDCPQPAPTQAQ